MTGAQIGAQTTRAGAQQAKNHTEKAIKQGRTGRRPRHFYGSRRGGRSDARQLREDARAVRSCGGSGRRSPAHRDGQRARATAPGVRSWRRSRSEGRTVCRSEQPGAAAAASEILATVPAVEILEELQAAATVRRSEHRAPIRCAAALRE